MKKNVISVILAVGVITIFVSGCAGSKNAQKGGTQNNVQATSEKSKNQTEKSNAYPVKIKNYNSEGKEFEVTFKEKPKRVITTNQPATELMLALGLQDSMVGTSFRDNPVLPELEEQYKKVPILSKKYPSKEVVLSKNPDMLFGWGSVFMDKNLGSVQQWNEKGTITFVERNSVVENCTVDNEFKDIEEIGKIFSVEEKANKVLKDMKTKIKTIEDKTKNIKQPVKVLVLEGAGDNKYYAYGKKTLASDMVKKSNGNNLADKSGEYSVENIIGKNPDVIVLINFETQSKDNKEAEQLLNNSALKVVNAVKNKRIVSVPLAETYVGGVRTINGIERLAKGFYPELFK